MCLHELVCVDVESGGPFWVAASLFPTFVSPRPGAFALRKKNKRNRTMCREENSDDSWYQLVVTVPTWASGRRARTFIFSLRSIIARTSSAMVLIRVRRTWSG